MERKPKVEPPPLPPQKASKGDVNTYMSLKEIVSHLSPEQRAQWESDNPSKPRAETIAHRAVAEDRKRVQDLEMHIQQEPMRRSPMPVKSADELSREYSAYQRNQAYQQEAEEAQERARQESSQGWWGKVKRLFK